MNSAGYIAIARTAVSFARFRAIMPGRTDHVIHPHDVQTGQGRRGACQEAVMPGISMTKASRGAITLDACQELFYRRGQLTKPCRGKTVRILNPAADSG